MCHCYITVIIIKTAVSNNEIVTDSDKTAVSDSKTVISNSINMTK